MLILKKKFFFSDQNIDRNDPVQLNLLYVQSRDAIVSGKHPCSSDEAFQLAALQCQIQYGNHEPDRHKGSFIDLKIFVPPEYQKEKKEAEKRIFQEHRKLQGLSELNAKFRYVQLCRSLKTYGVTFFEVKEIDKKNKLIPILLGVTRDSVMRLDAHTKEILKVWPLTTLRRFSATANSFTLDFGDYADSYYTVQTKEGDAISRLISGYIDIILKKRKDAERVAQEEQETVAVYEENVKPAKASQLRVAKNNASKAMEVNLMSAGNISHQENKISIKMNNQDKKKVVQTSSVASDLKYNKQQSGLIQTISNGYASVNTASGDLSVPINLPAIGNDAAAQAWKNQTIDINKQAVTSQIGTHLVSTASIIFALEDFENIEISGISGAISTLTNNSTLLISSAKLLAALMDGSMGEKLLEATKMLTESTSSYLHSMQEFLVNEDEEKTGVLRQKTLKCAENIGSDANEMLYRMGEIEVSKDIQQEFINLATRISSQVAYMIAKGVKSLEAEVKIFPQLSEYAESVPNHSAKLSNIAASLASAAIVCAPTMHLVNCQDQLIQGTLFLKEETDGFLQFAEFLKHKSGKEIRSYAEIQKNIKAVQDVIVKMVERIRNPQAPIQSDGNNEPGLDKEIEKSYVYILESINYMMSSLHDSSSIVNGAKSVTLASTQLVNSLKLKCEEEKVNPFFLWKEHDSRDQLMKFMENLTASTSIMVSSAKEASKNLADTSKVEILKKGLLDIQSVVVLGGGPNVRARIFQKLVTISKSVAAASTQLIGSAKTASPSNRDQNSQMQLNSAAKKVTDAIGALIFATRAFQKDSEDVSAPLKVIYI
jgi:talin